jgi:hypothetical protein
MNVQRYEIVFRANGMAAVTFERPETWRVGRDTRANLLVSPRSRTMELVGAGPDTVTFPALSEQEIRRLFGTREFIVIESDPSASEPRVYPAALIQVA